MDEQFNEIVNDLARISDSVSERLRSPNLEPRDLRVIKTALQSLDRQLDILDMTSGCA